MLKKSTAIVLFLTLTLVLTSTTAAAPPQQAPEDAPSGEAYTVQGGDWLSKIAEKYYGDSSRYPEIIEATNLRATEDSSFAAIDDPNLIQVGQKLWVPLERAANEFVVEGIPFQSVDIEALGIRVVVPADWPAVEEDDPLLRHAWSAGLFSFVSFSSTPGSNSRVGMARLLGVMPETLTSEAIGGQLVQEQFGDRNWTVFGREEGGVTSVVAATVQDKVIYQISLFAETSQSITILSTILENFEIIDPAVTQQVITIDAPAAGQILTNPFELRGTTTQYPFRGRLLYRVLDAEGNQVGRAPFEVVGRVGNPASFALGGSYQVPADGPGTVEVAELSAADGTIITIDSVAVNLLQDPPGYTITIDDPLPYTSVSTPLQVRGKTNDRPFEGRLNYRLVDAAGEELSAGIIETRGSVGQRNIFDSFIEFEVSQDGPGRLELFDIRPADGAIFTISTVNVWLSTTP